MSFIEIMQIIHSQTLLKVDRKVAQKGAGMGIPTYRPKLATWRVLRGAMAATATAAQAVEVAAGPGAILIILCVNAAVALSFTSEGTAMEDIHICTPNATLLGVQVSTVAVMHTVGAQGAIDSTQVLTTRITALEAAEGIDRLFTASDF